MSVIYLFLSHADTNKVQQFSPMIPSFWAKYHPEENQDYFRDTGFSKSRLFPEVGNLKSSIGNTVCLDFSADICYLAEYLTSAFFSQIISKIEIKNTAYAHGVREN